jgi:hypothetical protein
MQCENGYTKDGVRGILCREAEEPKKGDLGMMLRKYTFAELSAE